SKNRTHAGLLGGRRRKSETVQPVSLDHGPDGSEAGQVRRCGDPPGTIVIRVATATLLLLAGCAGPSPRVEKPKPDPTKAAAYTDTVAQLAGLNLEAGGPIQHT